MTTIHADTYLATTQATRDAIRMSIAQDEIVTIRCTGGIADAIAAELDRESDGSAETQGDGYEAREYWGADCDGSRWRVHVEVRS